MRCQHVDDDVQCRFDATRRVLVACGDPAGPRPGRLRRDDLHGPGLQAARPRPSAVDADPTPSWFGAYRRTSRSLGTFRGGPDAGPTGSPTLRIRLLAWNG